MKHLFLICLFLTSSAYGFTMKSSIVVLLAGQSNADKFHTNEGAPGDTGFTDTLQASYPGTSVTFINCAVGNTKISEWQPGDYYMNTCISAASGYTVDLIFFYQGESDCYVGTNTQDYQTPFKASMAGLNAAFPSATIIYAQLDQTCDSDYSGNWSHIQSEQAACETDDMPMLVTYPLELAGGGDCLHLSNDSYATLGGMLADRIIQYWIHQERRLIAAPGSGSGVFSPGNGTVTMQ